MTPEEFRQHGHALIDFIADYRAGVAQRPVMSLSAPGDLQRALPAAAPIDGEPFDVILHDVDSLIMGGLSHWQHPRFFGYFPSNGELSSVLGDYLSTGLGVLGLSWQSSPALTELELVVLDWFRQMVGLSTEWRGVMQDTASTATLVALLCARERASHFSLTGGGLQSATHPLVVYVSAESHSSVTKAALLAGFGRDNLRVVPADKKFAMDVDALAAMLQRDVAEGRVPAAIVATTGTTTSTAFDPIAPIAELAAMHAMWLHVDAAMAGSAMILPECRWMWEGVDRADSVVINVHKWLGVAFDCSMYYTRDAETLVGVMSTNPSYLQSSADSGVTNLRDWGVPLGRRFRALKLWCLLREQGVARLQARLRRDLENARWLEAQVRAAPGWDVVAPVALQTVCVRHVPAGLGGDALDAHTQAWADRINRSGVAYLTPAILDGHWMVRVSVGAIATEASHVAELWLAMQNAVMAG
jgi:aromatic-L-amino-acid/L-tryptophan decarboxylase